MRRKLLCDWWNASLSCASYIEPPQPVALARLYFTHSTSTVTTFNVCPRPGILYDHIARRMLEASLSRRACRGNFSSINQLLAGNRSTGRGTNCLYCIYSSDNRYNVIVLNLFFWSVSFLPTSFRMGDAFCTLKDSYILYICHKVCFSRK